MDKTKVKALIVTTVVVCSLMVGAFSVYAATSGSTTGYPQIVQKIAKAFNLDAAKVNDVFEADRKEMDAQREAEYEKQLDQAVTDGTITKAQKAAILKKMDEMKTEMEAAKNTSLSNEDRRSAMEKQRTEMEAWAKENGLEQKMYLLRGMMGGHKGGHGHGEPGAGFPPSDRYPGNETSQTAN